VCEVFLCGGEEKKCLVGPDGKPRAPTLVRVCVFASVIDFSELRCDVCVTCLFFKAEINLGVHECVICVSARKSEIDAKREHEILTSW